MNTHCILVPIGVNNNGTHTTLVFLSFADRFHRLHIAVCSSLREWRIYKDAISSIQIACLLSAR